MVVFHHNTEEIINHVSKQLLESKLKKVMNNSYIIGGIKGLFKGSLANVVKMAMINITLTGPYDYMKEKIWLVFGDFGFNHFVSLVWAASWCTLLTLPFDNVKTRMMKQFPDAS